MLRQAAELEREEWGGTDNVRTYPKSSAIHLAVADWLDEEAPRAHLREEQWRDAEATRVRPEPFTVHYDGSTEKALVVARAIFDANATGASDHRPQGTPGVYRGHVSKTRFEVVLDRDGLLWHRRQVTTREALWMPMPGWDADRFEADDVPEWVIDCPHDRVCDTEADCVSLRREHERIWGDR